MVDNTTLNLGAGGNIIATDDISSVHYQRVKLIHGADGVNDGDVATANPLPVEDTTTQASVANVDTNTTDLPNVIGTDGGAGPTNVLSVGGTESGGNIQEVRVDSDGHLQVDVLTGGGGGTERADDTDTHANGHLGTAVMGVATPTDGAVDANDYGHLAMSVDRRLHVDADIVAASAGDLGVDLAAIDGTAPSVNTGAADAGTLRVTVATGDTVTVDNGGTFATQDSNLASAIGTDGVAGPADVVSVGGTESGGNIQELRVDGDGHLQVDVLSGGGGGTERADDTDTHANGHLGTAVMAVANPTDGSVDANDYGHLSMSTARRLHVDEKAPGEIDATNSSTTPLGISATFTGTSTDILEYGSISVTVFADQNSATDGLSMEFSTDGTNWDIQDKHDIVANSGEAFILPRAAQFFRVVYTNGGTGQGAFRLETILNPWPVSGEIQELDIALDDKDLALTSRAVLAADTGAGAYENIGATAGGNLKVVIEEIAEVVPTMNVGNAAAGTQRVVLASDQPVLSVDDNAGSLTVDTTADATDSAAHGASQTGFRVMGSDGTNDQQISVNASGHVNIADGGNVITVDGTVTADAGTGPWPVTDNAGSLTVDAPVATPVNVQIGDGTDQASVTAAGRLEVDGSGVTQPVSGTVTVTDGLNIEGDVAHDSADSGNPVKIGADTIGFGGTNPTEVAEGDRTNLFATRAGQLIVTNGHPNLVTRRDNYTGAQTDTAIVTTTAEKFVVTRISVTADNGNTVDVQCRVGFGATTTPTAAGVLLSHPGIAPGSGVVEGSGGGVLGIGAGGEDIRITCSVPTGGSIDVVISYYLIAG